jgi:hypothetical protein
MRVTAEEIVGGDGLETWVMAMVPKKEKEY